MNQTSSNKTNLFAVIALMCTLGFTIAGFIWLQVEPTNTRYAQPSDSPKMSLEERIQLIEIQLQHQQAMISDIQEKIKHINALDQQIKTISK